LRCSLPRRIHRVQGQREATYGTIYVSTSAQMRMLTQRIAKAAQTGLIGSPEAFKQLQQSRDEFIAALKLLTQGGQAGDVSCRRHRTRLDRSSMR